MQRALRSPQVGLAATRDGRLLLLPGHQQSQHYVFTLEHKRESLGGCGLLHKNNLVVARTALSRVRLAQTSE